MSPAPDKLEATPLAADELVRVLGAALPALVGQLGGRLAVKDARSGRYVHVSPAMATFLGRPAAAVLGRGDAELFDAAVASALRAAEQTAQAHGAPLLSDHHFEWQGARHEYSVLRVYSPAEPGSAGGPRWLTAFWLDQAAERQREQQLRGALEQIEQQQLANDRLRREIADQALRDPASGLHRRPHFEDQLRREVDLSTREHREFSIVFIELDASSPKVLALGAAGEQAVLEAMGRLLRGGTRAMDASCRYDERRFAVLLSGVGLATAHARMEGLRRKCATQIVVHGGQELGFTVSVGLASFPHTAHAQDSLIEACEAALAEARRRGGNHVTLAAIRFESA
jgi:diguanylate cyclase (GGDEF)-like protein